ncbi:MAG: tRNA 2-thiouridine(34) synthase MnmA [Xanthomonadaceae bacterium]|nr:tRNA 2-thiouridine(34) synthase MnmA [Xanthomonadaceae bacterium]MDE1961420.1 tRNA 2-thiouridine(34) synthase MnmA [Xanthomonadaceae bacterium]MDE2084654.1 tRNA 2-thiouridine(34) synthase MnmA [Xanthomonadaceae bacterium]MDE2256683.1 tRNA 2-thiouridine(34) synthase MnmA [Xanthomonadaceae bacterium]
MVGMSGGVDSSVAALLLQRAGRDIAGLFMQNWEEDERFGECHAERDRADAVRVCAKLGIAFHARNFAAEYWDRVFEHFLAEYRAGRTPNPDVLCNREIKFKTFLDEAHALGADRIATGHYARTDRVDGRHRLLRGVDENKDQSYFLYALGQEQLAATLFPVGDLPKPEVRRLAREAGLPTHDKKDSTGICFIGERDLREFLGRYIPAQRGEIRTPDGQRVGEHDGVMYYTLGQRSGLGIGGRRDAGGEPWYVVGKDVAKNVLIVAQGNATHWLESTRLVAGELTWTGGSPPHAEFACTAKTRYRQTDQACIVEMRDDRCSVEFDTAQRAVTPGQSVVFYRGEECLGGGVIDATNAPFGGLNS